MDGWETRQRSHGVLNVAEYTEADMRGYLAESVSQPLEINVVSELAGGSASVKCFEHRPLNAEGEMMSHANEVVAGSRR